MRRRAGYLELYVRVGIGIVRYRKKLVLPLVDGVRPASPPFLNSITLKSTLGSILSTFCLSRFCEREQDHAHLAPGGGTLLKEITLLGVGV